MIREFLILFRVKDLEQRGRRISPEVGSDLIDLVEQKHRIIGSGLLDTDMTLPGIAPI